MDKRTAAEINRIKSEFIEAERLHSDEKACFLRVLNTFSAVVEIHADFSGECQAIKKMLNTEETLPLKLIQKETSKLRSKIFTKETELEAARDDPGHISEVKERLMKACRIIKKIMIPFLDGFYPVNNELKETADAINIKCHAEMAENELEEPARAFLSYVKELKGKISEDFGYVNKAFMTLLEQVKALEKILTSEFGTDVKLKEIDHFETKVNKEMGSIVNSFDMHIAINEIKNAVVGKLKNIRQLVARKKEDEMKSSQRTQKNIDKLKEQIAHAESNVAKMSRKAEHLQKAATRDGLTGLYNRRAFDIKVADALKDLNENEGEDPFLMILFDVDSFKWINDTFGHVAGDKILKVVAQCLKESFRKSDCIARYGGDEFTIIIGGQTEKMLQKRISSFVEQLKEKRFISHTMKKDINIGVSAGIAVARPGETPENLINRADMAMYDSKKKKG